MIFGIKSQRHLLEFSDGSSVVVDLLGAGPVEITVIGQHTVELVGVFLVQQDLYEGLVAHFISSANLPRQVGLLPLPGCFEVGLVAAQAADLIGTLLELLLYGFDFFHQLIDGLLIGLQVFLQL